MFTFTEHNSIEQFTSSFDARSVAAGFQAFGYSYDSNNIKPSMEWGKITS